MSYKVAVLQKKVDRYGDERIFISLQITDDLGLYNFGIWMHPEDVDAIKAEMKPGDFDSWTRLSEFRFLNPNSAALTAFCEEILPAARVQQTKNDTEESHQRTLKVLEAETLKSLSITEREALKEELTIEIMKKIKG